MIKKDIMETNNIKEKYSWRNKKKFRNKELSNTDNQINTEQSKRSDESEHLNHPEKDRNSNFKKQNHKNNKPKKQENKNLTHFINIPILDSDFIDAYKKFTEEILLSHEKCNILDFYPELLQKSGKLHMTICVLDLGQDKEKIDLVHKLMSDISGQISHIANGSLNYNFETYDSMGSQNSARVIYAKMIEDQHFHKLSEIIHLIIKTLVENNILDKKKLSDTHIQYDHKDEKYKIKLHMTLMNVLFLNKILKKNNQKQKYNINATDILKYMKERILPPANLDFIHFSRMREDKVTEKYELMYSYKI
jgi:hypothetical protein